jgi:hypothetical protein
MTICGPYFILYILSKIVSTFYVKLGYKPTTFFGNHYEKGKKFVNFVLCGAGSPITRWELRIMKGGCHGRGC